MLLTAGPFPDGPNDLCSGVYASIFYEPNWSSEYRGVSFASAFDFFSLYCFPLPFQLYLSCNMLYCAFQLTARWN